MRMVKTRSQREVIVRRLLLATGALGLFLAFPVPWGHSADSLMVGGYVQNINPRELPVPVNGGFVQQMADRVIDPRYTTWRARSSCLEPQAEPKIRERLLQMLRTLLTDERTEDVSLSPPRRTALEPDEALAAFETHPDIAIQLAACEPNVVDPVSIAFDAKGQMWVVEMRDYPTARASGEPWRGRIRVLRDQDDDGFFETATTFADNLIFPTGLTHFRNGIIVTLAGEIAYMSDTDGDLVCDSTETWFTGFSRENEQLRANHPTWTIENRVHVASGLRGGEIVAVSDRWSARDAPLSLALRDFEFSPFSGVWRTVAGNSQFGFYQDDAGQSYVCDNRNPCQLVMAEAAQVGNNPLMPLSQWMVDIIPAAENSQVFPLVDAWTTSNLHAGQFTAACGVYRYQSDLLRPLLENDFFACEPTGGLVQRYRMVEPGLVPRCERGREGVEFLASRDPWFRPVELADGPDGALYVVDMHRAVIEHPEWVPEELKNREDQRWGDNAGRIYRLIPKGAPAQKARHDLASAAVGQWVDQLAHPNRWRRTTAARLLVEAALDPVEPKHEEVVDGLRGDLSSGGSSEPRAAIRALWMLHTLGALQGDDLRSALAQSDASLRRQVVRLLARHRDKIAAADSLFIELANDVDARVRYQVILELAPMATAGDVDALLAAAKPRAADGPTTRRWISRATSLIADAAAVPFLLRGVDQGAFDGGAADELVRRLGWSGNTPSLAALIEAGSNGEASPLLAIYEEGMRIAGRVINRDDPGLDAGHWEALDRRFAAARLAAVDTSLATSARLVALNSLAVDPSPESLQVRRELLDTEDPELFAAAVESVRKIEDPAIGQRLVSRLPKMEPQRAKAVIALLVDNPTWTDALLDAVESGELPPGWLDAATRDRLRRHPTAETRQRAAEILAVSGGHDRLATMNRYSSVLNTPADRIAGRHVFRQHCASCHRIEGFGSVVGPDISDLRTQTREQILTAILQPNAAIDANYFRYAVLTTDGQILEGLLTDRGKDSVALNMQNGIERIIATEAIEDFKATGVSLMPEGFEQQIDPVAMRDLIDYLKQWRFIDGSIPGK